MPLEATMMILDNSEFMRNGDYPPTRFDAQTDAINIVFQTKTDSNPENSVGVMTMAGKGPEVLVTHTRELGQIIQGVHDARAKMGGSVDIATAINVAQLALKHRQNKNLRQRIIVFVGSPLDGPGTDEKSLAKLAKKLKKNNIAIDIVCFGDGIEEGETSALKTFVDATSSGDNSHLVNALPDPRRLLSDVVLSSAVLSTDRGDRDQTMADITNTAGPSGDAAYDEYGGIDPNLDPELAMVLRMSMEEERARQRAREQAAGGAPSETPVAPSAPSTSQPAPAPATSAPQPPVPVSVPVSVPATSTRSAVADMIDPDEEAALQEALRLSQQTEDVDMSDAAAKAAAAPPGAGAEGGDEEMDEDEEAAIARAIEMSMQAEEEQKK